MKPDFSYNTDHTIYVMTKNFTVDMIKIIIKCMESAHLFLDYQQYIYIPNRYILCRWRRKKNWLQVTD